MGKLGTESPFHEVHFRADAGCTENAGDLQRVPATLVRADNGNDGILFLLQFAEGNHDPVKSDRKSAGGHIIAPEQVREPVCPAAKDLVLCTEVLANPSKTIPV